MYTKLVKLSMVDETEINKYWFKILEEDKLYTFIVISAIQ